MLRDYPPLTAPYKAVPTPRGWAVVCRGHLVSDELKLMEANALADAKNKEHAR